MRVAGPGLKAAALDLAAARIHSRHYLREAIRVFTGEAEQGPVWLFKHNLLSWYREAVRDLIPVPVRVAVSRILRGRR